MKTDVLPWFQNKFFGTCFYEFQCFMLPKKQVIFLITFRVTGVEFYYLVMKKSTVVIKDLLTYLKRPGLETGFLALLSTIQEELEPGSYARIGW